MNTLNPAPVTPTAEDAQEVAADLRKLIDSAPAHIWIDLGEGAAAPGNVTFRDLREVSWSEDNATGVGIKYVRAPVAAATSDAEHDENWWHDLAARHATRDWNAEGYLGSVKALVKDAITSSALPIDFKQATDQGGWQLVPKEPTEEMLTAASHASMQHLLDCINDPAKADALGSEENIRKTYANRYQSMLAAAPPVTEDLSALAARLARALRKAAPGNDLAEKAMDYLRRKGLQGSPLRAAPTLLGVADGDAVGGKSGGAK
jgi:hypothetical protein